MQQRRVGNNMAISHPIFHSTGADLDLQNHCQQIIDYAKPASVSSPEVLNTDHCIGLDNCLNSLLIGEESLQQSTEIGPVQAFFEPQLLFSDTANDC